MYAIGLQGWLKEWAQLGKNGSEWHSDWKRSFSYCGEINVCANGFSPPWLPAEQTNRVIENTHLLSVIYLSGWQPVRAIKWSPSQSTHARHSWSSSHLRRLTGSAPVRLPLRKLFYTEVLSSQEVRRSGTGTEDGNKVSPTERICFRP